MYTWDTSSVAPGVYWIWSIVHETPPPPTGYIEIARFSPGVVSVRHPGDEPLPAIMISEPGSVQVDADETYTIHYLTLDPTGTGHVRIEATHTLDGSGLMMIADGLPASPEATYVWDLKNVPGGRWSLRATIEDAHGRSYSAWSLSFLNIFHAGQDAGTSEDAAAGDASVRPSEDAGMSGGKGCSCASIHRAL